MLLIRLLGATNDLSRDEAEDPIGADVKRYTIKTASKPH